MCLIIWSYLFELCMYVFDENTSVLRIYVWAEFLQFLEGS